MANSEQVKILKDGAETWNEWRAKDLSSIIPDFSKADLRKANLSGADLMSADLSGADLSGANLSRANLTAANLSDANLSGAFLGGTILLRTNLSGANLSKANLMTANLRECDLSDANLTDAFITGIILSEVNLTNTIFNDVFISRSSFSNVDLSHAKGLHETYHGGPSSIGIDTIYRSKGKIPEIFLRRAGVPNSFITNIRALTMSPIDYYSCFISYGHADKSFATRLHDALQAKGIRCWRDEHQLLPGDDLHDQIDRGIRLWDKVVLCCSEAALKDSWWVDKEIDRALQKEEWLWKERKKKTLSIIPVDLDGYVFNGWDSGKAAMIRSRFVVDFKGWETDNSKFEEQFEKLVKSMMAEDAGREVPPDSKL